MRSSRYLMTTAALAVAFFSAVAQRAAGQSSPLVAPGATPQLVNFDLGGGGTEGPSADADGNVYFTLTHLSPLPRTGWIEKWTWADGKVTQVKAVDGGAIGTAIDAKGRLLVGEWGNARITADDLNGHVTVLADSVDGRKLINPDALALDRKGGIYFAEWPGFKISQDAKPAEAGGIDYISPDGKAVKRLVDLPGAHKIILSSDGKMVIASGTGGKIWKFTVAADASLRDQSAFCTDCESLNIDPVAFDEKGNVYMAGQKLYIYSPQGEQLAAVDLGNRFSNAAFAGKDRKTLILTGHAGVFTLKMTVRGALTPTSNIAGR